MWSDYLSALLLAALPALGNFSGGVLAEVFNVSQRTLSLALHAAVGIVIAVVAIELMPRALGADFEWVVVLAFVAGGAFYTGVDKAFGLLRKRFGSEAASGPWMIFFAVSVDLFTDGIMIGTGTTIALGLGLLLALAQMTADVPEGFASIATFKSKGLARSKRFLLSGAFAIPILLGTTLGFWVVQGQPDLVRLSLLAFTAGVLITVSVEEMVREAHQGEETAVEGLVFVGGFALFTLISVYAG